MAIGLLGIVLIIGVAFALASSEGHPEESVVSVVLPAPDAEVSLGATPPDNGPEQWKRDNRKCRIVDGRTLGRAVSGWWKDGLRIIRFDMQNGSAAIFRDGAEVVMAFSESRGSRSDYRMLQLRLSERDFTSLWNNPRYDIDNGRAVSRIRAIMNGRAGDLTTTTRSAIDARVRWSDTCRAEGTAD
jgi:hypothetical protein